LRYFPGAFSRKTLFALKQTLFFLPLLALLNFWAGLLPAQESRQEVYNLQAYTTRDGLSQSQVRSILEDSRGYLWFGTHRGVSRFDGQNFTNFEPESGVEGGLSGNFIAALEEDQNGRIWLATERGVSYFEHERFFNEYQDSLQKVLSIMEDQEGRIWFGTLHRGLTLYDPDAGTQKAEKYLHKPFSWADPAVKRTVHCIFQDQQGNIWLGRDKGLYELGQDGLIREAFSDQLPYRLEVYELFEDSKGRLWLGTDQGAFVREGKGFRKIGVEDGLMDRNVFCIVEDLDETIWLGTRRGLNRFTNDKVHAFRPTGADELPAIYSVRSAIRDRGGNLWFGTEGFGVFKVTRSLFKPYSLATGLSSNLAKSFLEDDEGRIWISTYDQGINVLQEGKVVRQYGVRDGLAGEDIGYSFKDSRGNFWFTSYTQGVSRYRKGDFDAYTTEDGLPLNRTYCVGEGPQGRIWIGTDFGIAIWEGGKFTEHLTVESGLIDNSIYAIKRRSNGEMWIGTPNGLSIYREGQVENYDTVGKNIIAIHEDSRGRMWMASASGLILWEDGKFRNLRIDPSPSANNVVGIVGGGEKYLWLGTEGGIFRLDLEVFNQQGEVELDHFTRTEGLPSLEVNANALMVDSRSNIWIGTTEGAVRCPVEVKKNSVRLRPRTNLVEVRSSLGQDWDKLGFATTRKGGLPIGLKIPFERNRIAFKYIAISTENPLGVRYRFKLEGYEEEWSEVTRTTNASYANLSPGPYTFMVKAANEAEDWEVEPERFSFYIKPAFHQTTLFRVLVFLALLLAGYITYRIIADRTRRRREKEQMKFKAEKLALEHQALYAMMNPHFTFNALQSIQYYIIRQDKVAANKFLSRFAKLVRKNLESTRNEFISLEEELSRLDLYLSLEKMRFKDKFDYEVILEEGVDQSETIVPPMIFQPFVENSIKHGINPLEKDGVITVKISPFDAEHLQVIIRDNGIGIEASKARRASRPSDHVSRGMQITQDRLALFAKMTGKSYEVKTEELKNEDGSVAGTQVSILLPLND
jgi:ligand-binding sensor domain-containing protein/anti-sigma regulatory factor (Ser/Thr protein kinase)